MRTYRYLLPVILVMVFCQMVYAQRPPKFEPRTRNFQFSKVYPVSGESYYSSLRVLDVRVSKEKLGYLKTGSFNRSADLITEQPFDKMLSEYYDRMMAGAKVEGNGELVMVLHDIIVHDMAAGQQIATMFLDADFFGSKDGMYHYLGTADTLYEMSSDGDVSDKLLSGTVYKISEILTRFSGRLGLQGYPPYTVAELEGWRAAQNLQYEAYRVAGRMKPGVYYTAEQFLNNTPADTPVIIREYSSPADGVFNIVQYAGAGKDEKPTPVYAKDVFAVSDGKRLLCSHKRGFTKLRYENGEFLTVQYFAGIVSKQTSSDMIVMYGVSGALAVTLAQQIVPDKRTNVDVAYHSKFLPSQQKFIPLKRLR